MSRVVVTDYTFPDLKQEQAAAGADFAAFQCRTAEDVAAAVAGAEVAVVQFAPFGPAAAAAMRPGGTVIRYGVGYNNIDLEAAFQHGREVVHGVRETDGLLDRVAGNLLEVVAEDTAMNRLSDPEPLESLAPVETRPPCDAAQESARGNGDRFPVEIDGESHGRL
jgi:D-3-phosphoglycerate dehydrogenase